MMHTGTLGTDRVLGRFGAWVLAWGMLARAVGAEGLSAKYPGDVGIAQDPAVIFAESFEAKTVSEVSARWSQAQNGAGMSLVKDVPAGSPPGSQSLRMTSIGGQNEGGDLYYRVNPPREKLYYRFYVKYPAGGTYHHSGGGLGGYNPPTNYAQGQAGTRPTGSDRISVRAERLTADATRFDFYNYWMEMRGNPADAQFWGNHFVNDPKVGIPPNAWTCVEVMVKLNNPVSARNGEMGMWLNGKEVTAYGPGAPKGKWVWDSFVPDPAGQPFEGFRWRSDAALALNWVRLSHYVSQDPAGYQGSTSFDQVVVATEPIGCIGQGGSSIHHRHTPISPGEPSLALGPGRSFSIRMPTLGRDGHATLVVTGLDGRKVSGLSVVRTGQGFEARLKEEGVGSALLVSLDYPGGKFRRKVVLLP